MRILSNRYVVESDYESGCLLEVSYQSNYSSFSPIYFSYITGSICYLQRNRADGKTNNKLGAKVGARSGVDIGRLVKR